MPTTPKHFSKGHTIVPFPKLIRASKIEPKPLKKAQWIKEKSKKVGFSPNVITFNTNRHNGKETLKTARIIKLEKFCTHPLQFTRIDSSSIETEIVKEINDLFHFLPPQHQEPKHDIINLFNQKLLNGEIKTRKDVNKFLRKLKDLAECFELCLERNHFCENFMTKVSVDIFRDGFKPASREEIIKKYPNYFS